MIAFCIIRSVSDSSVSDDMVVVNIIEHLSDARTVNVKSVLCHNTAVTLLFL